jgi:hypothetical protein
MRLNVRDVGKVHFKAMMTITKLEGKNAVLARIRKSILTCNPGLVI